MAFYNSCCRARFVELRWRKAATIGDEVTCKCGNSFVYDGKSWKNTLELGQRKILSLTKQRRSNDLIAARSAPSSDLPF